MVVINTLICTCFA